MDWRICASCSGFHSRERTVRRATPRRPGAFFYPSPIVCPPRMVSLFEFSASTPPARTLTSPAGMGGTNCWHAARTLDEDTVGATQDSFPAARSGSRCDGCQDKVERAT